MPHRAGEPRSGVDSLPDRDELVGDGGRIGHQPLQPGPDPLGGRVVRGGLGQSADPLHHLRGGHRAARGVEHQLPRPLRVRGRELDRHPAAERLAVEVGPLHTDGVEQAREVLDVGVELQVGPGVRGVTVAWVVVGDHPEVLGQRGHVVRVGLDMTTGAGHQHQRVTVSGFQYAGAPRADVDVTDAVFGRAQSHPHRDVGRRSPAHATALRATSSSSVVVISASRPRDSSDAVCAAAEPAEQASDTTTVR